MASIMTNVMIRQRSVNISVNNAWKNLNDQERLITLDEPDPTGVCRGTGTIEIPNYIEHPLIAFIFRVEFNAHLPVKPTPR